MKIRIRYFASLREVTGQSDELLDMADGTSIAEIKKNLVTRYPRLQDILERCLCALNRAYVPPETALHENDELVFIPPMGGGSEPQDNGTS
ncbi:hypothetical protein KSC_060600 [Ktedonobacter sp. SOSP1-52]|uniref:molybdopterin converting factor subunit 1 n=1 Tax=Ktedonobacter sp. SOSP1-52 TaxID=2778366 RepID=UPI001915F52F|nr:molybdopterin converting factor subunit 1 [Ktedonobacter sp. SOSP1-52]GHO67168.1 hypothetical protein KSC_060600 [Ktedonobacter sp. SOSP1-52]